MSHALQVHLDEGDFRALQDWAQERGWTLSQTVRVALKVLTQGGAEEDPLLAASGMIDALPRDLSARVDEHLNLHYAAEPPIKYGPTRPRRPRKTVRR